MTSVYLAVLAPTTTPVSAVASPGDRLVRADGIVVGELMPGQVVELVPPGFHVIRLGQTLWAIARKYGVTVDQLKKWNPAVVPSALKVGSLLRVAAPVR